MEAYKQGSPYQGMQLFRCGKIIIKLIPEVAPECAPETRRARSLHNAPKSEATLFCFSNTLLVNCRLPARFLFGLAVRRRVNLVKNFVIVV